MPIDPMEMRTSVVMKEFMENYSREYRRAGFTEEECVETISKQFHVGKDSFRRNTLIFLQSI